jgi:alpha-glucosidase
VIRPSPARSATDQWWRTAVVYQIYIRSFADADGDGVGDIAGIRSRLPYLSSLGVDAVWITPWYPSPMRDGGYDVADYRGIDPLFGTLDDALALIEDAHAAGIRVVIDLVPNHTSSAHPWFAQALTSGRSSSARARYVVRDGRGPAGLEPPNNWHSLFGGPAWSPMPDDGVRPAQWYLHLFDASQPDLDWASPEVRAEFEAIVAWWLDRGVDGIRIDVADLLVKDPSLPDLPPLGVPAATPGAHPFSDREGVHEIYRAWRRIADGHGGGVFCAELNLPLERLVRYLRPDELHTAFNFDLVHRPWAVQPLRRSIESTLAAHGGVGAPATWVLGNHDLARPAYRLGLAADGEWLNPWSRTAPSDQVLGARRARAAALLELALPGSAYVYMGEELGLPEVLDLPAGARQDPTFRRTNGADIGRDGVRVPLPWSGEEPPYGFGPAGSAPWLPQPAGWGDLAVGRQEGDADSTLTLYRTALALRRSHPGLRGPRFSWVDDGHPGALEFEREAGLRCAVNLDAEPLPLPPGAVVLVRSDGQRAGGALPRDTAAWYLAR